MILRGLRIENWRCIRELELSELPDGIIVLHGPNRTGKSSLVTALRCCLFDCDHDAAHQVVKSSVPWNGSGPPRIVVQFAIGNDDYRLTKVFSKNKEGMARLEKKAGSQWKIEQDAPKEASRRTRELLGAEKSTAGLQQLLWLGQGETGLPQAKNIDVSLQARLVGVLGVMVTGPDFRFKQALDKRWTQWFTDTGRPKKNSRIEEWEEKRQKCEQTRRDETEKLRQWEAAIQDLQSAEDDLPVKQRAVDQAKAELSYIEQEREQSKDRLRNYEQARSAVQTATERRREARARVEQVHDAQQRSQAQQDKLTAAQQAVTDAQDERDRLARENQETLDRFQAASDALNQHRRGQQVLNDRAKLVQLVQRRQQLENTQKAVKVKAQEIADLEGLLADTSAPDEKSLASLRENRAQAVKLRAQLQAAELALAIECKQTERMEIIVDGQAIQTVELGGSRKESWNFRQRATVTLPQFGSIEVSRARANVNLEQAAAELTQLDRDFMAGVGSYQENPLEDACLDRLAERRVQKNEWLKQLGKRREELTRLAPAGPAAVDAEIAELDRQRQAIVARDTELAGWDPSQAALEEMQQRFGAGSQERETQLKQCEKARNAAAELLRKAEENLGKQRETLAAAKATAEALGRELQRLGDEKSVLAAAEDARRIATQAELALVQCQLTEEEKTIEPRWLQAGAALDERNKRLRAVQDQFTELKGFLQGNEGLHTRLADAEAALLEAERGLARERLEAAAHKRLHELFEQSRENQVQQVMGPISARVLDWAKKIGLSDCQDMHFGDHFLPEGIILHAPGSETPIDLDSESYGTSEQISLLVRLALGGILAKDEPVVALLDDPLAHCDAAKHRRILDVLRIASQGNLTNIPPAGKLQIVILTCHPDRFDHLPDARHIDLAQAIKR